jgi:hypothetical protein
MNWGRPHSIGHYLDFWSAVLAFTLFPIGYLFHTLTKSKAQPIAPANRWPGAMTVIEIRPHRWGWKVFETPGVEPVFLEKPLRREFGQAGLA